MVKKPFPKQTFATAALGLLVCLTGCRSERFSDYPALTQAAAMAAAPVVHSDSVILREGDVIKITFPGSPNLSTAQQIRRDGKISMQLVGELEVAGMTTSQLEKKLGQLYEKEILTKEVNVVLESSAF